MGSISIEDYLRQSSEDPEEYYNKLEEILIETQRKRNKLNKSLDLLGNGSQNALNSSEVWKLERIQSFVQMMDKDCQKLMSRQSPQTVNFDEIDHKIKEIERNSELIESFSSDDNHFVSQLSESNQQIDDNFDYKVFYELNEDINEIEKHLALNEVLIFENKTLDQLLGIEDQLRNGIKRVEKEISEVSGQLSLDYFLQMAIHSEIKQTEDWIQSMSEISDN